MIDTPNNNNLSNDVVIKGSIKFANEFTFDGKLKGDIAFADGSHRKLALASKTI
jgi:cytoskeletal protein CcmA (bactofilin family)